MKIKGRKMILSDKDNSSIESFDKALRKFKKFIRDIGIVKDAKDRASFEKPSVKKRNKRLKNKRNGMRKK